MVTAHDVVDFGSVADTFRYLPQVLVVVIVRFLKSNREVLVLVAFDGGPASSRRRNLIVVLFVAPLYTITNKLQPFVFLSQFVLEFIDCVLGFLPQCFIVAIEGSPGGPTPIQVSPI